MIHNKNNNIYVKDIFKWGDILLLLVIIVAIVLSVLFALNKDANLVEIYLDGQLKYTTSLSKDGNFELLDGRVKVVVKDGYVRISESDCANQICVHTKAIGSEGGVIVCLPNKVLVKVSKGGPNNITS